MSPERSHLLHGGHEWTAARPLDDGDADDVVGIVVKSAQTGRIGDGKVWVVPVDSVASPLTSSVMGRPPSAKDMRHTNP